MLLQGNIYAIAIWTQRHCLPDSCQRAGVTRDFISGLRPLYLVLSSRQSLLSGGFCCLVIWWFVHHFGHSTVQPAPQAEERI